MSGTHYYFQGGRRIEIEHAGNLTAIHAATVDEVLDAATRAGVGVRSPQIAAPGLVTLEIPEDRDGAMEKLRATHVMHHVYCTKGQPADTILITDTFFLKFKDETDQREIDRFLREERLLIEEIFGERSFLVRVTNETGRNPIMAANSAAMRDIVEYAEPNLVRQLVRCSFIPSDPFFPKQWHLFAPADADDLVAGAGINAPDAWEHTRGDRQVVIAVADDGFDLTHPDFQGTRKIAGSLNVRPIGVTRLRFDADVHPRAGDYHGTPCAGVALAEENGLGTVGVAPGCSFYAVRFPLTLADSQLARMFERISLEADVISCSWGFGPADAPMSITLRDSITALAATGGRRGKGLVFCVAAGNNNCPIKDLDNSTPYEYLDRFGIRRAYSGPIDRWIAAHPDVLTVSASTSLKTRSAYSSWGSHVNVCAPSNNFDDLKRFTPRGLGVWTTDNEGFGPRSDFTSGSRYTGRFGGTSSATPTVAGVCGLLISADPSLSGEQVRQMIMETSSKDLAIESETHVNVPGDFDANGFSPWFGYGKVDAAAAVASAASATNAQSFVDKVAEDVPMEIPDVGASVNSEIEITEAGLIEDLRVGVDITHTYVGDLRIDLIAPDGSAVTLQNHEGGSQQDLHRTYTPEEIPTLRTMLGKTAAGVWTLRVVDTWFWDKGSLESWRFAAKVSQPLPTSARAELMEVKTTRTQKSKASRRRARETV